jgi:hypothetical protein
MIADRQKFPMTCWRQDSGWDVFAKLQFIGLAKSVLLVWSARLVETRDRIMQCEAYRNRYGQWSVHYFHTERHFL